MWRAQKTLLNPKTIPSFGVLSSILCFFIPLVLELGRGELGKVAPLAALPTGYECWNLGP